MWRCASLVLLALAAPCLAQDVEPAGQKVALGGPRFLAGTARSARPVDPRLVPVLQRRVTLTAKETTLSSALRAISRQTGVRFLWSQQVVPVGLPVKVEAAGLSLAAALTELLLTTEVDVAVVSGAELALVRRRSESVEDGAIVGRVTDKATAAPLAGATVIIDGTALGGTASPDGRYRIADVPPGTYTVRARYIGYAPGAASVTVSADQEATADIALERSVQRLDEVVTTGTFVPTEVKALPTPVSVISEQDIELRRPETVQEIIRQVVPTAVSWDYSAAPSQTPFSARGASSLSPGSGQMKVFVDGVEAAYPTIASVDPSSIDRIEAVRGPQAAAIYGSDAIGGVIQVFTKRGLAGLSRPQLEAQSAFGLVETPYAGHHRVLRQQYRASVRGQEPTLGYHLGIGYSRTGEYLPDNEISAVSSPSVYGGMNYSRGLLTFDLTGRYSVWNTPAVFNPELTPTGFSLFSRPNFQPVQVRNQTVGGRLELRPTPWWRHAVTFGLDRYAQDNVQSQARLTTPSDTLLFIQSAGRTKNYVAYNTSVVGRLLPDVSGSITAGFDHYSLLLSQWFTSGAFNTTGTIQVDPSRPVLPSLSTTTNTGYFAQGQLGLFERLFLTGGARVEQNSNFGESLGAPLSPRAGVSYVIQSGSATLKGRGSYGRAIRAPSPGDKLAFVGTTTLVLANPSLGPERQHGWDAGFDITLGRTASLSVTYYDQTADDLIQQVFLAASPMQTFQFQNVGRVKNAGVEIEGSVSVGSLRLTGQYGYARARVDQLAPNYTGDLRVGDQAPATPKHTGGGSVTLLPVAGTALTGAITYVGKWRYYDLVAQFSCFGGTGPCAASNRDYMVDYPAIVKINLTASQQLTAWLSGFVSVDNLTNEHAFELVNSLPVFGRITTVGLRFQR